MFYSSLFPSRAITSSFDSNVFHASIVFEIWKQVKITGSRIWWIRKQVEVYFRVFYAIVCNDLWHRTAFSSSSGTIFSRLFSRNVLVRLRNGRCRFSGLVKYLLIGLSWNLDSIVWTFINNKYKFIICGATYLSACELFILCFIYISTLDIWKQIKIICSVENWKLYRKNNDNFNNPSKKKCPNIPKRFQRLLTSFKQTNVSIELHWSVLSSIFLYFQPHFIRQFL